MIRRGFSLLWSTFIWGIMIFTLLWTLFPMYWMLSTSLKDNLEVFDVNPSLWPNAPTLASYVNLGEGLTPIPAGYSLSRLRFRFRKTILMGVLVTQMFPLVVLLIPLYLVYVKAHLLNSYIGLILAFTSFTLPFGIWMLKGFIDSVPVEIEEAAMVDGCSRLQSMRLMVFPLIVPGIVATGVFAFLDAWNNLLFPLVLVNDVMMKTLPPGMILAFGGEFKHDWSGMMAASCLVSIPFVSADTISAGFPCR